jgi:IS5 family transposase
MMQTGFFDWQTRFEQLDNGGVPLVKLNEVVKWELFCDDLQQVRDKDRKSDADGCGENKKRQKDTDACRTQKNGKSHYGYKNHIEVDVEHKLIREYEVTPVSTHDSQAFEELLDEKNTSCDVWADSAYRSQEKLNALAKRGFREHLQRKCCRHKKLTEREKRGNHTRSKTRSRVEHIFGVQAQRAGRLIVRAIGLIRVTAKIGLRNLAYNIDRFCMLMTT